MPDDTEFPTIREVFRNPGPWVQEAFLTELERLRSRAENLEIALATSRTISCAVGILMAQRKLTYDGALEVLVEASQHRHRKLRDLADDVVRTGTLD